MRPLPEINPDTGLPVVTITFPLCPYGCGAFAGECDCAEFQAEMVAAMESPLRWGWSK